MHEIPLPEGNYPTPEQFRELSEACRLAAESATRVSGWMNHDRTELTLDSGGVPDDVFSRETLEATASQGHPTDPVEYADESNRAMLTASIELLDRHIVVEHFLGPRERQDADNPSRVIIVGGVAASDFSDNLYTDVGHVEVYDIFGPQTGEEPGLTITGIQCTHPTRGGDGDRESLLMFSVGGEIQHVEYARIGIETILLHDTCEQWFGIGSVASELLAGQFADEAALDRAIQLLRETTTEIEAPEGPDELGLRLREVLAPLLPEPALADEVEDFLREVAGEGEEMGLEPLLAKLRQHALAIKYRPASRLTSADLIRLTEFAHSLREP